MKKTAKDIIMRQKAMETERQPYEDLQNFSVKLAYPGRQIIGSDDFYLGKDKKGKMTGKDIFDSTAANALMTRNNGIMAFFMPQNFKWFSPTLSIRKPSVDKMIRTFLQSVGEQLRYDIGRSNYYEMKRLKGLDSDSFGASYLFIDEDDKSGRVMCSLPHPHQCFRGEDYWGLTNELHYAFTKTMSQVVGEFGEEALSPGQRQLLKEMPDKEVRLIHAIYRNDDFDATKPPIASNRRWIAYWVNQDFPDKESFGKIIREGGYNTINPIDWQLNKPTHELYGRGTVSQFIIEIMSANFTARDCQIASATTVRPPLVALDTLRATWNPRPAGTTWVSPRQLGGDMDVRKAVSQVIQTGNYQFGIDMLERHIAVIEARFGVPFFLMLNQLEGGAKTAYEIQQRQAERAALMSPFLASLSTQTDMELDRFFDIGLRAGRMPQIPEQLLEIAGASIDIEYSGPILQLLKQFYERSSLYSVVGDMGQLAQVDQSTLMNVDWDIIAQKMMISNDCPEDALVPIEDVKQRRAILAQQAMQEAQAEQTAKMAPLLESARKPIEGNSVMDRFGKVMQEAA